jgi:hypothetical protein
MTLLLAAIDVNNLWGEGDDDSDDSDDSSRAHSVISVPSSPFHRRCPSLPCPCTTLLQLSNFVSARNSAYYQTHRLKRPCLLTGYVNQWPVSTATPTTTSTACSCSIMDRLSQSYDSQQKTTTVPCLQANDGIHFFANGLCTSHAMHLFDQILTDQVRANKEPKTPFYCRLRPIPRNFQRLFGTRFDGEEEEKEEEGNEGEEGKEGKEGKEGNEGEEGNEGNEGNEGTEGTEKEQNSGGTVFQEQLCACWIGSAGTITPLHFDTCHGLLCVVQGTKKVVLFPPEDTMYLYRDSNNSANPNSSQCDWEIWTNGCGLFDADSSSNDGPRYPSRAPTLASYRHQFSQMEETSPMEVQVKQGEMLYIPPGWWHTVENVTATVAVLLPFDMSGSEDLHAALHLL